MTGRIQGKERRGRRRRQLMDVLQETKRYWKFKNEALARSLIRSDFGIGYGPVVRLQDDDGDDDDDDGDDLQISYINPSLLVLVSRYSKRK